MMTDKKPVIKPADRMRQLPEYVFGRLNAEKQKRRSEGVDIIDFGMGNPDMPASRDAVEKIREVLEDDKSHRYSRATGIPHLLRAVATHYKSWYNVDLDAETEIISTIGSKEGLSHLSLALLGAGDTCVVPEPYFPVHMWSAVIAGARVINIPVTNDADELIRSLEKLDERPKVLYLNYPHNPTGITVELPFFEKMVAWCRAESVILIHDFAYKDITFGDYKAPSVMQVPGARDIAVEFFTMSKSYNMAGWRVGFCLGNAEIIAMLSRIKAFFDYGMFTPIQVAAIVSLKKDQSEVRELAHKYELRRDAMIEGLARAGWDVPLQRGAMFVWAQIPEAFRKMGSYRFAEWLLDEAEVLVTPGTGFGEAGEGYVRMSLVENIHRIRQATRQIHRALRDYKG
ncbi:aminotransferase class I/II-fold pyridoxal phosphate-dependent enzyme [Balneolales bacterium ANBcel1]|nr:aminotransferase class I/II-fold pyridoxal phosphate-dependent enzyme [Balneolales bacterium ANBcel1]